MVINSYEAFLEKVGKIGFELYGAKMITMVFTTILKMDILGFAP